MQSVSPVNCNELLQLTNLGISQANISFSSITMESEKYICIREKAGDGAQIVIVDVNNPTNVIRKSISATSAIMNPLKQILGLKAGRTLQLFNLEQKIRMKVHELSEESGFWKWLSPEVVGIVTQSSTYGWSITGDEGPHKIFERHEKMSTVQIINFKADSELKWMILSGISGQPGAKVAGTLQLYSVDKKVSQILEGHAATFFRFQLSTASKPSLFFSFATRSQTGGKFYIIELSSEQKSDLFKKQSEILFGDQYPDDFPISMQADERLGLIFFLTKYGCLYIQEVESAQTIFQNRISQQPIFLTCPQSSTNGFLGISRSGQVLSISANDAGIIQHVKTAINNPDVAISLSSRMNQPGMADDLFVYKFNQLFAEGKYSEAVIVAAKAPGQILRNAQTIQRFQHIQPTQNQPSPLLKYFTYLLDTDKLNKHESIELCKVVFQQNRKSLVEKWLKEDKLECSEELGDLVRSYDSKIALSVYLRANVPNKVIELFAENGQHQNILPYAQKVGYSADYTAIVRNLFKSNPEQATQFALNLLQGEEKLADLNNLVQVFMESQNLPQITRFLLEALKNNLPEEAQFQNRLLELNLMHAPQVADTILGNKMFSHYDKQNIARLCERAGLFQRALENYTDIYDIKRALMNVTSFNPDFLVEFFGNLSVSDAMDCLQSMLHINLRQNLQLVVQIASTYHELLGVNNIIHMLESYKTSEGLFYFIRHVINTNEDPDVHYKYICAACRVGQFGEVERICRESNFYDPELVKNFLKESRLPDQLPLLIVCNRYDYIDDLICSLYRSSLYQYIEILVQKINPKRLPLVVGTLLRLDCPENVIKQLIMSTPAGYSTEELLSEVERHNRPKLVMQMLERALQNGSTDPEVHNALAKIYIDNNMNPERLLSENECYDHTKIGRYCESRNPQLACIAYEKGNLVFDLIRVCNENALFKIEARYLLRLKDANIWRTVLSDKNEHRRALIDQIVQTALPESQSAEDISVAVRSFLEADLTNELIELLEKIVLENTMFSEHTNLQNLLILTALRSSKANVSSYLEKLDKYDAPEIAKKMIDSGRFEDAFNIYSKFGDNNMAVEIMVDMIKDFERALDFAEKINEPTVWATLGRAQLRDPELVKLALCSYLKSGEVADYMTVIDTVITLDSYWDDFVKFILMVRKTIRNRTTDDALILAYAKCDRLNELEEFIQISSNHADINRVGDQCFNSRLFTAAKILFTLSNNYLKLSVTLVYLKDYHAAIESAKKANNVASWKGVCFACIDNDEFRLAKVAALNIVIHADSLQEVILYYEDKGYFTELLDMMESSVSLERTHMGIFTELAILFIKYSPSKTKEHVEMFWSRMNVPKVLRAAEQAHLWYELIFLYEKYEEYDNAASTFIAHPSVGYRDIQIKEILIKCASTELIYRAISCYIRCFPSKLDDLMTALSNRLDPLRAIQILQKNDILYLPINYLTSQHCRGSKAIDEAVNLLLIEAGDHEELLSVVQTKPNAQYDKLELAKQLQAHDLKQFRNISSYLMRQSNRFVDSVEICKRDELYAQAIVHVSESNDPELAYSLVRFFLDKNLFSYFSAILYHCYSLFSADRVLEYAWRFNATDFAMPFFIQILHTLNNRVKKLEEKDTVRTEKEDAKSGEFVPMIGNKNNLMIGGPNMF